MLPLPLITEDLSFLVVWWWGILIFLGGGLKIKFKSHLEITIF